MGLRRKLKRGKWEVATGKTLQWNPLGALVCYHAKSSDGMAAPTTRPAIFAGWKVEPGLRHRDVVQVLDYEALRQLSHQFWAPKDVRQKEVYFPPVEHFEYTLQRAAQKSLLDVTDQTHELRKAEFDRSLERGVLPYEVAIDAVRSSGKDGGKARHSYITFGRLLELDLHSGCDNGTTRHSQECRDRFDKLCPKSSPAETKPVACARHSCMHLCHQRQDSFRHHPRQGLGSGKVILAISQN